MYSKTSVLPQVNEKPAFSAVLVPETAFPRGRKARIYDRKRDYPSKGRGMGALLFFFFFCLICGILRRLITVTTFFSILKNKISAALLRRFLCHWKKKYKTKLHKDVQTGKRTIFFESFSFIEWNSHDVTTSEVARMLLSDHSLFYSQFCRSKLIISFLVLLKKIKKDKEGMEGVLSNHCA